MRAFLVLLAVLIGASSEAASPDTLAVEVGADHGVRLAHGYRVPDVRESELVDRMQASLARVQEFERIQSIAQELGIKVDLAEPCSAVTKAP